MLVEQGNRCCLPPADQKRVPESDVEMSVKAAVPALACGVTVGVDLESEAVGTGDLMFPRHVFEGLPRTSCRLLP